ncbi:MAG TPA: helix-turn-helix domain-containing protein [Burkholderiales bacterium]|nr:helix-turn-helix domain-containing protein [Burkholderiales bacterium]
MTDAMSYYDALDFGGPDQGARSVQGHEGANVSVRDFTRLLHIDYPDDAWLARTTFALRRVREGEALVHAGDKFHSLYVVRSGCFKTVYTDFSGSEQVLGFPMCGDLMGADGIDSGRYSSTAVSLDTSEVVIVPLASLARLVCECPSLEALLYRVLSRELVRVQNMAWTLGTLGAEGRVAAFLLGLSARLGALGYSRCSFNLRMTRQEIGSYLGLKLETVSRALSALNSSGVIQVHQRSIDIVDADALRSVIDLPAVIPAGIVPHPRSAPARSRVEKEARTRKPRAQLAPALAWRELAAF